MMFDTKVALSLVAVGSMLSAIVVPLWNVLMVVSAVAMVLAGGMWTIFLLDKADNINTGDDLDFWMLRAWRFMAFMVMVLAVMVGFGALWLFGWRLMPVMLLLVIDAIYALVIVFFLSFKIGRRQRMVGIWRSKP